MKFINIWELQKKKEKAKYHCNLADGSIFTTPTHEHTSIARQFCVQLLQELYSLHKIIVLYLQP